MYLTLWIYFSISKRAGTRRHYHDDGISDEEIEGRRTFDLEEKVNSQRFSSNLVNHMEGKGKIQPAAFYTGTFVVVNEREMSRDDGCEPARSRPRNDHVAVVVLFFY